MPAQFNAIAIDGPAGAGKSTVAGKVAARLNFLYVDTGAMYRAVALKATRAGVNLEDEAALGAVACGSNLEFDASGTRLLLDGVDVSREIRSPEITAVTRYAARAKPVREELVRRQREMAAARPVVMEGRDITTVVLRDARWKFYLSASPEERARRRAQEMSAAGHAAEFDAILRDILDRDASDMKVGPLKEAYAIAAAGGDIMLLDTTGLDPDGVAACIVAAVERAGPGR